MLRLVKCEYLKCKRSIMLLVGLLGTLIVPFFVTAKSVARCIAYPGEAVVLFYLYDDGMVFLMLLFGPMVLTILGAWIVGREYTDGTLKNIYAIPVPRTAFLAGKLLFFVIAALAFMFVTWLEILALALVCGCFFPLEFSVFSAVRFLVRMLLGAVLLCATQTPLLYLAIRSRGLAAPFIAIAAVCLVNVVLSGSSVAGYYPWAAAHLLISGRMSGQSCPKEVSIAIIAAVCLLGIAASLIRFQREEITA